MKNANLSFFLPISHLGIHCIELTQPGSMVSTPGQSLSLTCKVSGYSVTDSSYCTDWIRQPAGKALEWITTICGSGATDTKSSLRSKFSIARDSSSSTVTLSGQNLQTEDTAVYYCARRSYTVMQPSGGAVQKLIINTYSHIQHVKHTVCTSQQFHTPIPIV
uniref:Ig-like domain-containing protein n=1 Tax=Astyanax mexicanus TaxID=7994 RepID=A0A8B9JJF7_ASTMX